MNRTRFGSLHEFFRRSLFYPLALSTALCAVLLAGRLILSGQRNYDFLAWNLFLAWLPYLLSLWIVSLHRDRSQARWKIWLAGVLWALFLPNAPYIMTDFGHILHRREFPLMYDIVLIFAGAWTGLLLGLTSLYLLQGLVREKCGRVAAGGFVASATLLTGAGIYLGRFLRWNSWDVLRRPGTMIATLFDVVSDPMGHKFAWAHTLVFTTVVLMCYLTFLAFRDSARQESHL